MKRRAERTYFNTEYMPELYEDADRCDKRKDKKHNGGISMIELKKDKKSPTWIITTTDIEGFHRQLNLSSDDLDRLTELWKKERKLYSPKRCYTSSDILKKMTNV